MTDSPHLRLVRNGNEPEHDPELANLLRGAIGTAPAHEVEWESLAERIMRAVAQPAPWWSYAARWEKRVLPLALAAGILGAIALWSFEATPASASVPNADLLTAVVDGTPVTDATATYANQLAGVGYPAGGVPE